MKNYELTIIGAGPVGLFASYYAKLRNLDTCVIESLEVSGGQINALYPNKEILDVAGFLNITGEKLVDRLTHQAQQLKPTILTNTTVVDVVKQTDEFKITTNNGQFTTKAIVIATGKGNFTPRKLPFENLDKAIEKHIHYFITDTKIFENKRVLVAGGGDSAVDLALQVNKLTKNVHLMHRRNQFRALEHNVLLLKNSEVILEVPYLIKDIYQNVDGSLSVVMQEIMSENTKTIEVDEILVSYGFVSENKTVDNWQLELKKDMEGFLVNQELQTNQTGVFAIGDVAHYPGKTDLISTGFGEAPIAINAAVRYINPNSKGPIHSSSLKIDNGEVMKG